MKNKTLYAVTHEHRHGVSSYLIRSSHCPSEEEVVAALDIDWEPDRGEVLTISPIETGDIKDIPDRPEGPGKNNLQPIITGRWGWGKKSS